MMHCICIAHPMHLQSICNHNHNHNHNHSHKNNNK